MAPSALVQIVDTQASEKGIWHAVDARCKPAQDALHTSRSKYLEQRCVLDAAESLVNEAEALLAKLGLSNLESSSGGGSGAAPVGTSSSGGAAAPDDDADRSSKADAVLREAGLSCDVATCQSLSRHIQVAQAMQRLALPDVQAPGAAGRKGDGGRPDQQHKQQQQLKHAAAVGDPSRDGSVRHLLGVTPETLRESQCLGRAAAQRAHAGAARAVEARLAALAQDMVVAVMGDGAAGDPSAAAQAVQAAREAVLAAAAAEAGNARLLRRHTQLCGSYLDLLGSIHSALLELVEGCMLGKQERLDEEHCKWLVSHVRTLHSKLRVLQAQLHVATYTSESVPALRAIAAAIAQEEEAARSTIERVSAQLLAYQECGPEFADIVWQYGQVKEELRKVEHALHHFSQLELEMELTGG